MLGEVFTAAGYETVHFGKCHDGGMLKGFERIVRSERCCRASTPMNNDSYKNVDTTRRVVAYFRDNPGRGRPFLAVADLITPHNICQFIVENAMLPILSLVTLPQLPGNFRCADWVTRPISVQYICCTNFRQCQASHWTLEL